MLNFLIHTTTILLFSATLFASTDNRRSLAIELVSIVQNSTMKMMSIHIKESIHKQKQEIAHSENADEGFLKYSNEMLSIYIEGENNFKHKLLNYIQKIFLKKSCHKC